MRRRRTEIDPLLGTVTSLARESGVATPALDTLIGLVHDIENGRRELGAETFECLMRLCHERSHRTAA